MSALPVYQRRSQRGLSGKRRGLAKEELLGPPGQQGRQTSAGSYLPQSSLQVTNKTEPQFLAGPSSHHSRRDTLKDSSHGRRGPAVRSKPGVSEPGSLQNASLTRRVSVTSMEDNGSGGSGHSSGSEDSLVKNSGFTTTNTKTGPGIATAARPQFGREFSDMSGLGESTASFFDDGDESFAGDDFGGDALKMPSSNALSMPMDPGNKPASSRRSSGMKLPARPMERATSPTNNYGSSLSASTGSGGRPTGQAMAKKPSERRTFEDLSSEAKYVDSQEPDQDYEMEISPGVYLPFRGPQETWRAVDSGNILESFCLECGLELVSVADCQCIVCSECKMVNPVFEHPAGVRPQDVHGAGMGLQKDWVMNRRR